MFSEEQLRAIDECVREHLEEARQRAAQIIEEQKALLITLRDMLLEHKVLDAKTIAKLAGDTPNSTSSEETHG